MDQTDQLPELFRRQKSLNQRIGVNFNRQESGDAHKDHGDPKHI